MRAFIRASLLAVTLAVLACGSDTKPQPVAPTGSTAQLAVLETTDLHQNVLGYDYYKLAEDKSVGIDRIATLVAKARTDFANTLLVDNGDTIQGTVLGDYQATVSPVLCTQPLAIHKAMNALKYDVGGVGNHEFNYGLSYLNQVTGSRFQVEGISGPSATQACQGPNFPLVLSNVVSTKSGQPLFQPYVILEKTVAAKDPAGKDITSKVKIGVIAFTPPYITIWDKGNLEGKVTTTGLRETATKYVAELKAKGADIIVAISHGGLDAAAYDPGMENGSYYLAQVAGIDVLLLGHSHLPFPLATSTVAQFNLPNVDKTKGTVFSVPTTMANFWGKSLGVVQLHVAYDGTKWNVDTTKTVVELRSPQNPDKSYVDPDPSIAALVSAEHQATISYVKTPIGTSDFELETFFADVGDPTALQIVNQAQATYVQDYLTKNRPDLASLPVLSVTAPFKSGFGGGTDYTDVASGNVAINNAADLYLFANTIYAVKVKGSDIQAWLETAAKRFNQIDPTKTASQQLVSTFPGYNFDVFTDSRLSYEIDVTQPIGSRIKALKFNGAAIDPAADFIVATNNYRASGGGNFPGLDGSKTVLGSPDSNRDVLVKYIQKLGGITRTNNGATQSWRFTKVTTAGPVVFSSAPGKLALAAAAGVTNVSVVNADDGSGKGLGTYAVDLSAN